MIESRRLCTHCAKSYRRKYGIRKNRVRLQWLDKPDYMGWWEYLFGKSVRNRIII